MMSKLFKNSKGKFCALTISNKGYNLAKKFLNLKININEEFLEQYGKYKAKKKFVRSNYE